MKYQKILLFYNNIDHLYQIFFISMEHAVFSYVELDSACWLRHIYTDHNSFCPHHAQLVCEHTRSLLMKLYNHRYYMDALSVHAHFVCVFFSLVYHCLSNANTQNHFCFVVSFRKQFRTVGCTVDDIFCGYDLRYNSTISNLIYFHMILQYPKLDLKV